MKIDARTWDLWGGECGVVVYKFRWVEVRVTKSMDLDWSIGEHINFHIFDKDRRII